MNHAVVIDASVAFKLVIEEEFSDRAEALFNSTVVKATPIFGPPHLSSEVCNAIHQRLRRSNITEVEADQAVARFLQLPIQTLEPRNLYQRALYFARTNGVRSIYDSLYVVLAEMLDAELWTDDRRLLNSVESVAPWVHWIGDYPLKV